MSIIEAFKPNPVIATMAPGSDTVKWSDSISAPIIIPLTVVSVVLSIIILCIIKCLKSTYDRRLRCDRYEITDLIKERPSSSEIACNLDTSQEIPDHPNLNLIKYSGEKKRLGHYVHDQDVEAGSSGDNSPPSRSSNGGRVRIEVHDSSNENNDNLTEDEDEDDVVNIDDQPQISTYDSSPYSHHAHTRHVQTTNQFSPSDSSAPSNSVHYANEKSINGSENSLETAFEIHPPPATHNPLKHAPLASTESEV